MRLGLLPIVSVSGALRLLLLITCLLLINSCAYRAPAPVDDGSTGIVKRQLNSDGTYYVRTGDTLYAIAFAYGVDVMNVAKWNNIVSPYTIYPGQKLRLKAPGSRSRDRSTSSGVQITTIKKPSQTTTRSTTSSKKQTSKQKAPPASEKTTPDRQKSTALATPKPTSTTVDPKSWKWPTQGRIHRTFVAGDPARNGLDLAGQEGQAIVATSAGNVVYSGNGLIGYGELIIIKHSENMLSAYAHNKSRVVNEGEQVAQGQKIAEMGRNSAGEQLLHFEIRSRGKPVNPLNYLPKK